MGGERASVPSPNPDALPAPPRDPAHQPRRPHPGAGKSTLLRLIMGTETPREGRAEIVAPTAEIRYYEQDQAREDTVPRLAWL